MIQSLSFKLSQHDHKSRLIIILHIISLHRNCFKMGVCGYREINTKDHSHAFDVMPPDTEALKSVALPILSFYVLLSDIKIKKCSYVRVGVFRILFP